MTSVDIQLMPAAAADFSKDSAISSKLASDLDSKLMMNSKQVLLQRIQFKPATKHDEQYESLKKKYTPLNTAQHQNGHDSGQSKTFFDHSLKSKDKEKKGDGIPAPKIVLFAPERVELNWKFVRRVGPGLSNMGNTCFLNSVLQVLTYTAPLVNYLQTQEHTSNCVTVGFCMLCELQRHVLRTCHHHQNDSIKPMTIIQKLKFIAKHLRFGHQEDSHEFLRYVIDGMQKSCLGGQPDKLERFSKETTLVHQIFGGYYRSQVRCLRCQNTSNTYDPLMEIMLDIKHSPSVIRALHRFTKAEVLDGENLYQCPRCKRKVSAQKQVTIHRSPNILTIQLKRFDYNQMFEGKISKDVDYSETLDLRHFMSNKEGPPVKYRLYAVLVHSGYSSNSGHYYCYIKGPSGSWYLMNDSIVRQVGLNTVLNQQAYLLFYQRIAKQTSEVMSSTGYPPKPPYSTVKSPFTNGNKKPFSPYGMPHTPKVIGQNDLGKPVNKPVTPVIKPVTPTTTNTKPANSFTPTPLAPVSQRSKFSFTIPLKSKQHPQTPGSSFAKETKREGEEKRPENTEKVISPVTKGTPVSVPVDLQQQKTENIACTKSESSTVTSKEKYDENANKMAEEEKFPLKKNDEEGRREKEKSLSPKKPRPPPLFIPRTVMTKGQSSATVYSAPAKATTPWVVTPKVPNELKFGPMSPPPMGSVAPQQSPMSAVSDVSTSSSIVGKSGDWTVFEKAGNGSNAPPKIPERQHAGWRVTKKMVEEGKHTEEKREENDGDKERHKKKKKHKEEKKEKKKKKKKKNQDVNSCEEVEEKSRKKKKKKRKKERREKDTTSQGSDEEELLETEKGSKKHKMKQKEKSDSSGEKKRRLVDYSDDSEQSQSPECGQINGSASNGHSSKAKVRVWDESVQHGKHRRATWDGSRDSSAVNELLSNGSGVHGYGNAVSSWDGGVSTVNSNDDESHTNRKRERRDSWDDGYDEGALKKVKNMDKSQSRTHELKCNPFQREHDYKKNDKKGFRYKFSRALQSSHGHSHRSHGYRRLPSTT